MERISIQELANILITKNGLKKKDADRFIATLFDVVKDGLLTDRIVKVKGLGTFKIIDIEPRESVNVNTGERVVIEGHSKITFTPDATMRDLVNKPFAQFETVALNDGVVFDDEPTTNEADSDEEDTEVNDFVTITSPLKETFLEETPVVETPVEEPNVEEAPVDVFPVEGAEVKQTPAEIEPTPVEEAPAEELSVEETSEESAIEEDPLEETPLEEAPLEEAPVEETPLEKTPLEEAPVEETVIEETMDVPTEETTADVDDDVDVVAEKKAVWPWVLVALVACGLSFAVGYYVGHSSFSPTEIEDAVDLQPVEADTIVKKMEPEAPVNIVESPVSTEPTTSEAEPQPKPVKSEATPQPQKETVETSTDADDYRKYEKMDARVRTGAYRIVGTATEVKVKAGENVKRISNRHLGPDMDCYVEVYNGIKATTILQEGQTLKIPKLELKKKKKVTKINE